MSIYLILAQALIFISVILIIFAWFYVRKKDIQDYHQRLQNAALIEPPKVKRKKFLDFRNTERQIRVAGYHFSAEILYLTKFISVIGIFTIVHIVASDLLFSVPAGAVGFFMPNYWLKVKKGKRRDALRIQIVDWLEDMANLGEAGLSFLSALEQSAARSPEPFRTELKLIIATIKKDSNTSDADAFLQAATYRIPFNEFKMVAMPIAVHREVGGSWTKTFRNISTQIKDKEDLFEAIRAATTESRITSYIVGFMPIVIFVIMKVLNPAYAQTALDNMIGRIAYLAAFLLSILGMFLVRYLSDVSRPYRKNTE